MLWQCFRNWHRGCSNFYAFIFFKLPLFSAWLQDTCCRPKKKKSPDKMPSQVQSCLIIYCILPFLTVEDAAGQYSTFQCFKEIYQGSRESMTLFSTTKSTLWSLQCRTDIHTRSNNSKIKIHSGLNLNQTMNWSALWYIPKDQAMCAYYKYFKHILLLILLYFDLNMISQVNRRWIYRMRVNYQIGTPATEM